MNDQARTKQLGATSGTLVSILLTAGWAFSVLLAVYYQSFALVMIALVLGLSSSIQIAHHKGYPSWLGVFAALIGIGPLLMWAVPNLVSRPKPPS